MYILYNDSHTIIEKDKSLTIAYKKYRKLEDTIRVEFNEFELGEPQIESASNRAIEIKGSNKTSIYFLLIIIGIFIAGYTLVDFKSYTRDISVGIQTSLTSMIRSFPSTVKNTLIYTKNGKPICHACVFEELIDSLNLLQMSESDMERIRGKVKVLKENYGFKDQ